MGVEDRTVFEFVTEDSSSGPMKAIAAEQDNLKDSTAGLAAEWETAHERMDTVSADALKDYQDEVRNAS